jgi:predicted ArsR family transcriptional regulator
MANNILLEKDFTSDDLRTPLQNILLKTLEENGPLTRSQLVKQLNTPRTTIYDNLLKLQKRKVLEKYTRSNGQRGRPLVFWKLK